MENNNLIESFELPMVEGDIHARITQLCKMLSDHMNMLSIDCVMSHIAYIVSCKNEHLSKCFLAHVDCINNL